MIQKKITHKLPSINPSQGDEQKETNAPFDASPLLKSVGIPEPGAIFVATSPTQMEQLALDEAGVPAGAKQITPEVWAKLARMRSQALAESENVPNLPTQGVQKPPKTVAMSDLPAEKQQELQAWLQKVAALNSEEDVQPTNEKVETNPVFKPVVQEEKKEPPKKTTTNTVKEEQKQEATENLSTLTPSTGATVDRKLCPHCGWDLAIEDPTEITEYDKNVFIQAWLGGLPFEKTYPIIAGRCSLTFRELSARELDVCYRYCVEAKNKGLVTSALDMRQLLLRGQMCLGLVSWSTDDTVNTFPSSLQDWKTDKNDDDVATLERLCAYVLTDVLKTESRTRLVATKFAEFELLLNKLEVWASQENF